MSVTGGSDCLTRQETRAGVTAVITEDASGILAVNCATCGEALVDDDRGPFYDAATDDGTAHVCKWKCGDCDWTGIDGAQHERDTNHEHFTRLAYGPEVGDKTSCRNCGEPAMITSFVTRSKGPKQAHAHHDATDDFACDPAAWKRLASRGEYTGGFAAWPLP